MNQDPDAGADFGAAALRAAHLAAAALGWAPAQFWGATPAELRTALGLDVAPQAVLDRPVFHDLAGALTVGLLAADVSATPGPQAFLAMRCGAPPRDAMRMSATVFRSE